MLYRKIEKVIREHLESGSNKIMLVEIFCGKGKTKTV